MTVVVVGAGVHGLGASRALAQRGHDVVTLEQFRLGHTRGSSHGASRVFRVSYADEQYVRLAQEALAGWRALERESGEELLLDVPMLDVGAYADDNARALEAVGVDFDLLRAGEVARRFGVSVTGDALVAADSGILLADRCLAALAAGARAADCELREDVSVTALEPRADGVRLETTAGPLEADAVVVAAGPWASRLLATAGIDLEATPSRETVTYLRVERDGSPVPTVLEETRPGRVTYGLHAPGIGVKAGIHASGPLADPDDGGGQSDEIADEAESWARSVYGDCTRVRVETCMYTRRPGEHFALERHGRIVVGSACSGHGFKFGPATGERLAVLCEEALR